MGLNIIIKLNKTGNDFKGFVEIKWLFIKIFHKDFSDDEDENDSDKENNEINKNNKDNNVKVNKTEINKGTEINKSEDIKAEDIKAEGTKTEVNNDKNDKDIEDTDKKEDKSTWEDIKPLIPLIRKNLDYIFDFLGTCLNSVSLKRFNTHIILGLSSYADTANKVGSIWAFSHVANLYDGFNLTAEPIFNKEAIDIDSEIIFKIRLLSLVKGILKLLTKKDMIKLILKARELSKNE